MAIRNICQIVFIVSAVVLIAQVSAQENTNADTNVKSPSRIGSVGSPIELEPDHKEVKLYLDKAYKKFATKYPGDNYPVIVKTVHATRQLVAGLLYKITINIGTSDCAKSVETPTNCVLLTSSPITKCIVTAWVKSWENFEQIDIVCDGLTVKFE